jgi:hypothetical protein
MNFRSGLNPYYQVGLLTFLTVMACIVEGHGNLHDFAEEALLGAVPLVLMGIRRTCRCEELTCFLEPQQRRSWS